MKRLIPKRVKDLVWRVLHSNSSKREVADGLAIGVFVAFTPLLGIHMLLALLLTRLLHRNSLIALAAVWITNPFTAVPIFLFNLWVGKLVYNGDVAFTELYTLIKTLDLGDMLSAGKEILIPLWLGSILVGIFFAYASQRLCLKYYERIRDKLLKTKEAIHFRTHHERQAQKESGPEFSH